MFLVTLLPSKALARQARQVGGRVISNREATRFTQLRLRTRRSKPRPPRRRHPTQPLSDHHSPGAGKAQLSKRQPDKAGIGLAVLDIIVAGGRLDEFTDR